MGVTMRKQGDIGFVEMDNPPVNAIGQSVRQGLWDAVQWAESHRVRRVVLSGAGRLFAAGADAREFDKAPIPPHLPDVLDAIENSQVPWVAAINGAALGGGAEIALACRARVMAPAAVIGFPEVTLGVIPGAGGTQRLPRLVGLEVALEMISLGKPVSAEQAVKVKLVESLAKDPTAAACQISYDWLERSVPTRLRPAPDCSSAAIGDARAKAGRKLSGQNAPLCAIDVIEAGLATSFSEAMAFERKTFLDLRTSQQARALRHVFFAERGAKAPPNLTADPVSLDHIVVVGGGTMGAGIACALLNANLRVTLIETDESAARRATKNVEKIIQGSLSRGLITTKGAAERMDRLSVTCDYGQAQVASIAIEAAFEDIEVKKQIFGKLQKAMPADAILATNTSYLDVNEIAASVTDPTRVVGLHFFAPAHIMKLLEIVRGAKTGDRALASGFALAKTLRKTPVVAGVCDGFIGNRILARYREAADAVLLCGATPQDVDAAMRRFGYAMGPYEAQDLSGLDIAYANRRRQDATRDPNRPYVTIGDQLVESGRLGVKTGNGWNRYETGGAKSADAKVAGLIQAEALRLGIKPQPLNGAQISERLVLAMINEAAGILAEGIAESAADIDLVTILGYGFPRWRGGLLHHADTMGVDYIVNKISALQKGDPIARAPSPMLLDCHEAKITLAQWQRGS